MEIVDAHQHVGNLRAALGYQGEGGITKELPLGEDARRRLSVMQQLGVDWAVLQPSHGYLRADGIRDTMRVNDRMALYREQDPARFKVVLGTVEPMHGERSLSEIDRIKHELKLNGVSWHHRFQGCYIDCHWMFPYLRRMTELQLVPIVHINVESTLESIWRLQRLAREFSALTFIAYDGLYSYNFGQQIMDTAFLSPNVVWDIGGHSRINVEQWVRKNGSRNICFSAEVPYGASGRIEKPKLLEEIQGARISEEDKANILGLNLRRIFRLDT